MIDFNDSKPQLMKMCIKGRRIREGDGGEFNSSGEGCELNKNQKSEKKKLPFQAASFF
jgi:hypothetical protein